MMQQSGWPEGPFARVDRLLGRHVGRVAPAMVLYVIQDRKTIFEHAYGYLDPLDRRHLARLDSAFDLASVTKLFTCTAFFRLVTQGRVEIDTSVCQVLPRFSGLHPIGGTEDPITKRPVDVDQAFAGRAVDRRAITFRHLLMHTSGLAAWRGLYREEADTAVLPPIQVPTHVRASRIEKIYDYPFIYPTGEKLVYSDLGLILLGEAVARLCGEGLDRAIHRLVLEPLGIADRAWFNPLACGISGERLVPTEYCAWRGRRLLGEVHDENAAGLGGVAGHAGLFATAAAVAALGQLYLNGGSWNEEKLLDPHLVAESVCEQVHFEDTRRGLGWLLYEGSSPEGPFAFGHTGYTGTSLRCYPDRNLIVVLLTNRVYYGRDGEGIMRLRPLVHEAVRQATDVMN